MIVGFLFLLFLYILSHIVSWRYWGNYYLYCKAVCMYNVFKNSCINIEFYQHLDGRYEEI